MIIHEEKNRFYLGDSSDTAFAEITYSNAGEGIYIIDHTYVHPEHQGQGIAKQLVASVVQKARNEGKKIMPLCPFANAEFERTPEYIDVRK